MTPRRGIRPRVVRAHKRWHVVVALGPNVLWVLHDTTDRVAALDWARAWAVYANAFVGRPEDPRRVRS